MRFQTLFKHRKYMMALAILMVILAHTKGAWPESALKRAAAYFYVSVDIFFFCSGVGCFRSCTGDRDPVRFLARRAKRILPAYIPFILVWIALKAMGDGIGFQAAVANLLGAHGLNQITPSFNWYVSGMWISYLLAPLLATLAERCDTKAKGLAAVLFLTLLTVTFWNNIELIIIASRMPIFMIGMLFAAESRRRDALTKAEVAALLALVPAGLLLQRWWDKHYIEEMWNCGLAWYAMIPVAPGLCVIIAAVCERLSRYKLWQSVGRAVGFVGGITFEIYLVHFWALERPMLQVFALTAVFTAALYGTEQLIHRAMKRI